MMLAMLATLISATTSGCTGVAGADRLWEPAHRWVIVGEMHGTNEIPDAFSNLVCLAAATRRPVTVALEYPADDQQVIDTYLASNGGERAKSGLLTLPMWHAKMQDGRSSVASLRLFGKLRQMKQTGLIKSVVAADVGSSSPAGEERDALMAKAWTAIPASPNGLILALVGNVHAMRKPLVRPSYTIISAASLMPTKQTITVNVLGSGGEAWNCREDGCHAHGNGPGGQKGVRLDYSADINDPWDAIYELGIPTTAAVPALASAPTTVRKH